MSRMILLQYSRPLNDRKGVYFLSWTPSCSSFGKIGMSLFTGLLRVVACVFTTADLTRPWPSGSTCKTRANQQKLRGTFSSRISTISPSTRFRWGFCHLLLSCITTRYSFFHRDQNRFAHIILLKLSWWGQYHSGLGCQDVVRGKWLEITWLARDCRQGSWINNCVHFDISVRNESSSKQWPYCSIKPERTFLVVLIWRSHTPPMWLATDGLKIQSMFSFSNSTRISSWSTSSMAWSNSFHAPTKFVPLSLLISLTGPRRLWSDGMLE